ncbi:restriction endonuclease subunit S [Luteolibacter sp. AS25]|uniref:restriction endonuclease subunit S n=1 Tax=Luteolibacter sp. AS25 TaxID=3135776 RepID=UPI00398B486E
MSAAETLITEHLDTWTSAIKAKSSAGRGGGKKEEFYGIKKLRELILELAVRGLLVSQDPKDEPASELLKKISKEKAHLVKEGKLKKPKKLPPPSDGQLLFKVPPGWVWVRLGDAVNKITDGTHHSPPNTDTGDYLYISAKNIKNDGVQTSNATFVTKEVHDEIYSRCDPEFGDILYIKDGATTGIATINDLNVPFSMLSSVALLKCPRGILNSYLLLSLRAPYFYQEMRAGMTGVAITRVTLKKLDYALLSLPPLAEQQRIVAKVEKLMALCDQLEQKQEDSVRTHGALVETLLGALTAASERGAFAEAWQRIASHFDTLFTTESSIDQLKQTILQLAIMGKLVEQDPGDESAEKIIKNLTLERNRLIKEKVIPKAKKLESPREKPHTVPSTWCWTQLGSLTHLIEYGTSQKSNDDPSKVPVYRMGDIKEGSLYDDKLKFVPPDIDDLPRLFLEPTDILFNRTNSAELVGKAAIFKGTPNTHTFASYLIRVRVPAQFLKPEFINLCFQAPYFRVTQIDPEIIQQCGQANFNGTKLAHTLFPIPPLAEQLRIVAKVDELMALCDQLKASLATAQATQLNLADTLVEQAIG